MYVLFFLSDVLFLSDKRKKKYIYEKYIKLNIKKTYTFYYIIV